MVFPPIGASFGSPQGYLGADRWITALHLTAGGCIRPAAEENGGKPVGGRWFSHQGSESIVPRGTMHMGKVHLTCKASGMSVDQRG